jgi:hypothetical protein
MDSPSVLGFLDGPTVVCVGTTTEQFAALAGASDGSMVMVYLPDSERARRLLSGGAGEPSIPKPREPSDGPAFRVVRRGDLRLDADRREATWRETPLPSATRMPWCLP